MKLTFCTALTLEFSQLKVYSDNSTFIRTISGNSQSKKIIGIMKDIRWISSGFASMSFSPSLDQKNVLADALAKKLFKPLFLCNRLQEMGHLWAHSLFLALMKSLW